MYISNIYLPARFGPAYAAAICRSKDLWLMKGKHGFLLQKIGAYTIQLCLPAIEKNWDRLITMIKWSSFMMQCQVEHNMHISIVDSCFIL